MPVGGFEGYYDVSNTGKVRSVAGGKSLELKQHTKKRAPYQTVSLCRNGTQKNKLVHRLMAEAFLPNPEQKPTVNHKDGNPRNNNLDNLEWATHKEQEMHSYKVLGKISPNHSMRHPNRGPKTHCAQGHEYTVANKYIRTDGVYYGCRRCNADAQLKFQQAKRKKES